ncbi:hypothetical protein EJ08DRAFT_663631 [Tothia fuscella]|uniref:Uncharacterized protein n=1 Tax=Tothia fuscella TaxID=1048955 RepID=A0A9P4NL08_9PEZI|nr:hypothetical protein EJ08DRAFT_663631 [Tothia fuscella]
MKSSWLPYIFMMALLLCQVLAMPSDMVTAGGCYGCPNCPKEKVEVNILKHFCNVPGWGSTKHLAVNETLQYLSERPGQLVMGGGHGVCKQISCSWDTAVWACNNTPDSHTVSWCEVVEMLRNLQVLCDAGEVRTNGQVFSTDNWHLILRDGRC